LSRKARERYFHRLLLGGVMLLVLLGLNALGCLDMLPKKP
jgi:hypothetical protein